MKKGSSGQDRGKLWTYLSFFFNFSYEYYLSLLLIQNIFKTLDLDMLSAFTNALRDSALNCTEHLWSPLNNKLSGAVFSNIMSGDSKPPYQQTIKCGEDITI